MPRSGASQGTCRLFLLFFVLLHIGGAIKLHIEYAGCKEQAVGRQQGTEARERKQG